MRAASETFVKRLRREFPDLRIRWSPFRRSWQIEQKVGRGALGVSSALLSDRLVRARDGYWLVCEVQQGDRMQCPVCKGGPLKVPSLHFGEVRCEACMSAGRDGRVLAGYFPLGQSLLEHLRETDPRRDAIRRMAAKADAANDLMLQTSIRDRNNAIEAATKEDFNRLFGIQSVGWTPATR